MTMKNSSFLLNLSLNYPTASPTALIADKTLEFPLVVVLCTMLGVACVVGVFGNALVLLSIIKFDNLRAVPDLFIFSLSLSDFLVTAFYQPLKAYRLAHLQDVSAKMDFLMITSSFLGHVSLIASITNMFGVTVERLVSIRFPLKYDLVVTRSRAIVTVICIWIFSATYGGIWAQGLAPESYLAIYFVAVLVGTVSMYIYIFSVARRLEQSVTQLQNSPTDEERPSIRKERKAAKTIAIILGVAIVCWLPVLTVPRVFINDPDRAKFFKIFSSLQVLSVCNSSINPYIYCARSRRYYVAFAKLLGLQNLFKVQVAVAPAYTPRDQVSRTRDASPGIQPLKGEIYDIAL